MTDVSEIQIDLLVMSVSESDVNTNRHRNIITVWLNKPLLSDWGAPEHQLHIYKFYFKKINFFKTVIRNTHRADKAAERSVP